MCVCVCVLIPLVGDLLEKEDAIINKKKAVAISFSFSLRFYLAKIGLDVNHTEQQNVKEVILAFRQLVLVHTVLQHVCQYRKNQRCLC